VALPGNAGSVAVSVGRGDLFYKREFFASGSSRRHGTPPRFASPVRSTRGSGLSPRRRRENWISRDGSRRRSGGFVRSARRPEGKRSSRVTADGRGTIRKGRPVSFSGTRGFPALPGGGEVQLSLRDRVLRLSRARASCGGGAGGRRFCRTESGMSREGVPAPGSLAAVPWKAFGVPVSLAGREKLPSALRERRIASKGRVDFAPRWHRTISSQGGSVRRFGSRCRSKRTGHFRRAGRHGRFLRLLAGKRNREGTARDRSRGDGPSAWFTLPPAGSRPITASENDRLGKGRRGVEISGPSPACAGKRLCRDRARDSCASPLRSR